MTYRGALQGRWPSHISSLTLSGISCATNNRFVFFNTAGTKLYVLSDAVGTPVATSSVLAERAF